MGPRIVNSSCFCEEPRAENLVFTHLDFFSILDCLPRAEPSASSSSGTSSESSSDEISSSSTSSTTGSSLVFAILGLHTEQEKLAPELAAETPRNGQMLQRALVTSAHMPVCERAAPPKHSLSPDESGQKKVSASKCTRRWCQPGSNSQPGIRTAENSPNDIGSLQSPS